MWEKVIEIVSKEFEVMPWLITEDILLREGLGADSIDMGLLLLRLENEFGIELDIEEFEQIQTIGELKRLMEGKKLL